MSILLPGEVLAARVGHTIGNGGGGAELRFLELWKFAPNAVSAALHSSNPLDLNERQISELKEVQSRIQACSSELEITSDPLATQKGCERVTVVHQSSLYSEAGEPKSQAEMWQVLMSVLMVGGCESALVNLEGISGVAGQLALLKGFVSLKDGYSMANTSKGPLGSDVLSLSNGYSRTDLIKFVRKRLGLSNESPVNLRNWEVRSVLKGIEINAGVSTGNGTVSRVLILVREMSLVHAPTVIVVEGGNGIP